VITAGCITEGKQPQVERNPARMRKRAV